MTASVGARSDILSTARLRYYPHMETPARPYHHGDLRRALLDAALAEIAEGGPGQVSLRELARPVGVSHAAPRHHFGDKRGLLTAVAVEGFELLAVELGAAWQSTQASLKWASHTSGSRWLTGHTST